MTGRRQTLFPPCARRATPPSRAGLHTPRRSRRRAETRRRLPRQSSPARRPSPRRGPRRPRRRRASGPSTTLC
ncbi:MAG: hypothetical protein EB824_00170 [Thaumarchaeota archaeon S15]|nr:MAG: hypothetical protein EB824_00170 [Thaumarchaeota archaeon S15]